ncbi:MAG TPA: histidine phosphatase family protein [Dongiaceae bacterium]|nr:histidine phosphatase family protein [Dongiaceae bacterium]
MILIRHGQSEFNVVFNRERRDPGIRDAPLTAHGRTQVAAAAAELGARMRQGLKIKRLLASPYTRAVQTAVIIAEALDLPIEIEPLVREHAAYHCDIGTPASELAELWPALSFDHLAETWWSALDESETALLDRCRHFHQRVAGWQDWQQVAVVSHWGFIRGLTGHEARNAELVAFDPHRQAGRQTSHHPVG